MFTKVLSVNNRKTEKYECTLGIASLYPKGTIRYVKKLIWFKWKELKQVAEIDVCCDSGGDYVWYNKWKNIKEDCLNTKRDMKIDLLIND